MATGAYRDLRSYQSAEILHDATVAFCGRFIGRDSPAGGKMIQAARAGKQNIVEGSAASFTSKKTELKLIGSSLAALEGLLADYQDYLKRHDIPLWGRSDKNTRRVRRLAWAKERSYLNYRSYIEEDPAEVSGNVIVCLIRQTIFLLDQHLRRLQRELLEEGGFTGTLYRAGTRILR